MKHSDAVESYWWIAGIVLRVNPEKGWATNGTADRVDSSLSCDAINRLKAAIAGKKKDAKKIIINSESGGDDDIERNIFVSYIRESPIWKTSYRLIFSKQQALE